MRANDFGYSNGYHDKRLTKAESAFVSVLWDHVGYENAISGDDLARLYSLKLAGFQPSDKKELDLWKRDCRLMHNHLLKEHSHIPILSRAGIGGGYWIAADEGETTRFYDAFRSRGLTGLIKASRGKKAALVDLVEQLSFQFDDLVDKTGLPAPAKTGKSVQTPVEVVDVFLERMTQNPERFSEGLRKLGRKYGTILLPKAQVEAMRAKAAELQQLVSQIGV